MGLPKNWKPLAVVAVAAVAAAVGVVYSRNWAACLSHSMQGIFCNLPTHLLKLGLHSHHYPKFRFHSALLHPTRLQAYLQNFPNCCFLLDQLPLPNHSSQKPILDWVGVHLPTPDPCWDSHSKRKVSFHLVVLLPSWKNCCSYSHSSLLCSWGLSTLSRLRAPPIQTSFDCFGWVHLPSPLSSWSVWQRSPTPQFLCQISPQALAPLRYPTLCPA